MKMNSAVIVKLAESCLYGAPNTLLILPTHPLLREHVPSSLPSGPQVLLILIVGAVQRALGTHARPLQGLGVASTDVLGLRECRQGSLRIRLSWGKSKRVVEERASPQMIRILSQMYRHQPQETEQAFIFKFLTSNGIHNFI